MRHLFWIKIYIYFDMFYSFVLINKYYGNGVDFLFNSNLYSRIIIKIEILEELGGEKERGEFYVVLNWIDYYNTIPEKTKKSV